ncbi:hypothetical protein [Moraxella oblonga]|uniref:hypothetical protein n=1 Tax=Moraxella oblonga TaxID=200413 RepID=UPI00082BBB42|nr:hypothetical protein [Moraxella oblonga]
MPKYLFTLLFISLFGLVACQKSPSQPTYQVFYYDINKPNELYPLGETTGVAFGYVYDFKGIEGKNLGILWQGELKNTQKDGLAVQSDDITSLKINGQEIKLSHNAFTQLSLDKGKYPIEIRYEPKWHAGEAVLNFLPKDEIVNPDELPQKLGLNSDDVITFATLDEQSVGVGIDLNTGQKIEQTLATNTLPHTTLTLSPDMSEQVLVLSSPSLLNVHIIPDGVKVKAIIAFGNIGQIVGVDGVPIYRMTQEWDDDWWATNCDCIGGTQLHCSTDEGSYQHINTFTQTLNGQSPTLWYRQESGWQSFDNIKSLYTQAIQELADAKARCGGEASPSFTNNAPSLISNDNINTTNAGKSWLSQLGVDIPQKGFVAYYFNRDNMTTPIATENVPHIGIKYPYKDFHDIPAEKFAGAWAGYISVPKDTMMSMQYDMSWSQLRVFLDGKEVFYHRHGENGTPQEGSFDLLISKGRHRLDVEHINHWHTVGFALHPQPKLNEYPNDKAKELVNSPAYDVVSVSVYESENRDSTLPISLPNTQKPVVLVLKSHNSVFWQLPTNSRIHAVIIKDGRGVVTGGTAPVLRVENLPSLKAPYQHFYEYAPAQVESHQFKMD